MAHRLSEEYFKWGSESQNSAWSVVNAIYRPLHLFLGNVSQSIPYPWVWVRDYAPLRERIEDRPADFRKRGLLTPAYVDHVRGEHMSGHATYFGKMLWVMLILEEWLAARGM